MSVQALYFNNACNRYCNFTKVYEGTHYGNV
jgi:hypothetical protein